MRSKSRNVSSTRSIYLEACAEIAQAFLPLGFQYRRSKPKLVRKEGDFLYEISFGSSRYNMIIPDDRRDEVKEALELYGKKTNRAFTSEFIDTLAQDIIELSVKACVRSSRLQNWRNLRPLPLRNDDVVAGDELGRLRPQPAVATFNLGPIATRKQSIVEVIVLMQEVLLPFFNWFRKPEELLVNLFDEEIPGFGELEKFDFVLCFGSQEQGIALLNHYLQDQDVKKRFVELLPEFKTEKWRERSTRQLNAGLSLGGHSEFAGRLAQIAAAYQLA